MICTCPAWPLAAALISVALAGSAMGGAMTVSPTRIDLSIKHPIATMEVSNDGPSPVTVQLELLSWTQTDGADQYVETNQLIATPSVFEIKPHAAQVLRVALRNTEPAAREQAFRVYATEVPSMQQLRGTGLQMSLRIGVPIFVAAQGAPAKLSCELHKRSDGKLLLAVMNTGGQHEHVLELEMRNAVGNVLWRTRSASYVLISGAHEWALDDTLAQIPVDEPLHLSVVTEDGVKQVDTRLSP